MVDDITLLYIRCIIKLQSQFVAVALITTSWWLMNYCSVMFIYSPFIESENNFNFPGSFDQKIFGEIKFYTSMPDRDVNHGVLFVSIHMEHENLEHPQDEMFICLLLKPHSCARNGWLPTNCSSLVSFVSILTMFTLGTAERLCYYNKLILIQLLPKQLTVRTELCRGLQRLGCSADVSVCCAIK